MSNTLTVGQSIIIGGAGGAVAGIVIYLVKSIVALIQYKIDSIQVYNWMKNNVTENREYRTTRAIASHNNLTMDRVRFICSKHSKIYLSTGLKEDRWGILPRNSLDENIIEDTDVSI